MSDRISELEEMLSEEADAVSYWRSLLDSAGWRKLLREMRTASDIRKEVVCTTPIHHENGVMAQEFFKGEFSGIEQVLKYPEQQLESAKTRVAILQSQLENEREIEARASAVESRVDTGDNFG